MATSTLYETLEISKDATPEQIRKAYKKKALLTHPDRLPPNATAEEKANSEERFRKVNNAYEVLNDAKNRRLYDLHGVWPPPADEEDFPQRAGSRRKAHPTQHHYHQSRAHTFPDSFFPHSSFMYTDPFALFDSIFGDFPGFQPSSRHFHHHRHHPHHVEDPFRSMRSQLDRMMADSEHDSFTGPHLGFPMLSPFRMQPFPLIDRPSYPHESRGNWVSESVMTQTINGVTQSVRKRRDREGNEHVTHTYPDGREVHTINGIEQPPSHSRGYLPSGRGSYPESRYLPPPPHSGPQRHHSLSGSSLSPPPPYPGPPQAYGVTSRADPGYGRYRDRRYPDNRPTNPYDIDVDGDRPVGEERRHRKRRGRQDSGL